MERTRIAALLEDLQREARARKLTKKDLAALSGLHANTLRHFRAFRARTNRAWSPSVETLEALERILLPPSRPSRRRAERAAPEVHT